MKFRILKLLIYTIIHHLPKKQQPFELKPVYGMMTRAYKNCRLLGRSPYLKQVRKTGFYQNIACNIARL
jgi:hypothetical protein